jgi:hypothetical protein
MRRIIGKLIVLGAKKYRCITFMRPIVAKVDRLMALCDQLKARLAQSQRDINALLSAIFNYMETASQ